MRALDHSPEGLRSAWNAGHLIPLDYVTHVMRSMTPGNVLRYYRTLPEGRVKKHFVQRAEDCAQTEFADTISFGRGQESRQEQKSAWEYQQMVSRQFLAWLNGTTVPANRTHGNSR